MKEAKLTKKAAELKAKLELSPKWLDMLHQRRNAYDRSASAARFFSFRAGLLTSTLSP